MSDKMKSGVFTENFIRIDTDDGVGALIIVKKRKGDVIDFNDRMNSIQIQDSSEAKELIKLIQDGIDYLDGKR